MGWLIILAALVFSFPSLDDGLVSDDYELIEEARFSGTDRALRAFTEPGHNGFYRPIPRLLLGIQWDLNGLDPSGYHLLNILTHAGMSLAVYTLFGTLGVDFRLRAAAGLLFAAHFAHVEPVYWVSSRNETLAALLYTSGLALAASRSAGFSSWGSLLFTGALLCKETAITFPLALGFIRYINGHAAPNRLRDAVNASAPYWGLLAVYGVARASVGAAWPGHSPTIFFDIHPVHLARNLGQYTLQFLFPTRQIMNLWNPETYIRLSQQIQTEPLMAGRSMALVMVGLITLIALGALLRADDRAARIGAALGLTTLLPYLFMQGTGLRYLYLPSAGLSLLIAAAGHNALKHRYGSRLPALVGVFLAVSLGLAFDQARWWSQASAECRRVIAATGDVLENTSPERPVFVNHVPRRFLGAYVFHNGFEAAMRLYYPERSGPVFDGDRALERRENIPDNALIIRYQE